MSETKPITITADGGDYTWTGRVQHGRTCDECHAAARVGNVIHGGDYISGNVCAPCARLVIADSLAEVNA